MKKSLVIVMLLLALLCACSKPAEPETRFFHGISYQVPASWTISETDNIVMCSSDETALNLTYDPAQDREGEPISYNDYSGVVFTDDGYECQAYRFQDGAGDTYEALFINADDETVRSILDGIETN